MSPVIDQAFECPSVHPADMDRLWAAGWRHFGSIFFRYSHQQSGDAVLHITPLRIASEWFAPSRSQKRVLQKNADLRCEFGPAAITADAEAMFQRHKGRFQENVPETLRSFLSDDPARVPCECVECRVWEGEKLIAVSFLDVGERATSAVYGVFDPEHAWRSLGIYTMLREMDYSWSRGCCFYYPGYATRETSAYDYKKQFHGLESLNWATGAWEPMERLKCAQPNIK